MCTLIAFISNNYAQAITVIVTASALLLSQVITINSSILLSISSFALSVVLRLSCSCTRLTTDPLYR